MFFHLKLNFLTFLHSDEIHSVIPAKLLSVQYIDGRITIFCCYIKVIHMSEQKFYEIKNEYSICC